jgi:hypothetical protein
VALGRLPRTSAALAAGDIDLPRAKVIADETAGLTSEHAAAVENAIIGAAAKRTTGQLRAATHRAVQTADPAAARKRKEEALREARVERWTEPAGTAALAGRDLPPAAVLAADANLTALARQLKAAGLPGTMDALRAEIYLALLTGIPVADLVPAVASRVGANWPGSRGPDDRGSGVSGGGSAAGGSAASRSGDGGSAGCGSGTSDSGDGGSAGCGSVTSDSGDSGSAGCGSGDGGCGAVGHDGGAGPGGGAGPCTAPPASTSGDTPLGLRRPAASPGAFPTFTGLIAGSVNLTIPLATWLGLADTPGHAAGFGPLDATDSRALADALGARADTKWCLTVIGPDGRPVAHGCARAGPSPPRRRKRRATGTGDRPAAGSRDGPGSRARDRTWTVTITPLDDGLCDHAWETPAYEPTPGLRHLVRIRHVTCTFPGCRRPAAQCDADHTLAYDRGGRTCLCNLAPLCRHHHQVKQARGWALQQASPGVLTWTTPAGRRYTTTPTSYSG